MSKSVFSEFQRKKEMYELYRMSEPYDQTRTASYEGNYDCIDTKTCALKGRKENRSLLVYTEGEVT